MLEMETHVGRQGRPADAGRPSGVARDRLAERVRADVADVRVRLEEAVLRSDVLLATGQPERAAAVLDEQHALVAELRDTLAAAVAAASVEAEAEAVLLGSPDGATLFGADEPVVEAPRRSARATASALVSAVAALALLIVAAPTPTPDVTAAADRGDATGADVDGGSPSAAPSGRSGDDADDAATERAIGPNELEVRRLFASPAPPSRRGTEGIDLRLSGLQALVDTFVATVVRAAGELAPAATPLVPDEVEARPRPVGEGDRSAPQAGPAGSDAPDRSADRASEDRASEDRADSDPAEAPPADDADRSGDDAPDEDAGSEPGLPLPPSGGNSSSSGLPPLE